uniref:Uncharacterized protein n=1 Tax=Fagus sylvatica TaxID=28930 RepID=A0A2N9F2Q0_FAGSY
MGAFAWTGMVLLVKEWAKAHGINDSTSETFNSYSLTLLVIFHFQQLSNGLPNTASTQSFASLSTTMRGNFKLEAISKAQTMAAASALDESKAAICVRTVAERRIAKACADNIRKFRNKKRLVNPSSLSKLFVSFLAKIEDPFEQLENSARTVNKSGLRKISEAFESSHRSLISANQNEDQGISTKKSLLATLVQERVSELIGSGDGERPNSSVFSVGFLLGGLVAGIGYMYAPKIAKAADDLMRSFRNDSDEDSDVRTCLCICNR